MHNVGFLWDDEVEWNRENPFDSVRSNDFARYTKLGEEENLKVFIAKYSWYNDGKLDKAFYWNGESWEKVHDIRLDGVYDKYKFDEDTRELKQEIHQSLPVVNNPELEELCKDKLKTYDTFPDYVPETRIATLENARKMLENGKIVFKPRYGFAGHGVRIIESIDDFETPEDSEKFIIQRFVKTKGAPMFDVEGPHDLRTIVIDGEIQDGNYIRVPDEGLISNISRGGSQKYVDKAELPESVLSIIREVSKIFEGFQPGIFSVDFMFDDSGKPIIVELNSKPGTYYHHPVKEEEKEVPKIKNILKMIRKRIEKE